MQRYSHRFAATYSGPVAFGFSREVDEASLIVYVQKLADDRVMALLRKRLSDEEIHAMVDWITALLHKHLSEGEYHSLFLGEEG